jgi:hypothetical protein
MGMIEDALREYASYEDRSTDPSTPASGSGLIYFKNGKIHSRDDAGTVVEYGPAVGGGGEFTESQTVKLTTGDLTTTSATFVDATGLTVTLTTAAVRCLVLFSAVLLNSGSDKTTFDIAVDGTRQGQSYGLGYNGDNPLEAHHTSITYLTGVLTAASHTIKIQWRVDGGTGTMRAATTTTPAILQVIETSMAS